MKKALAALALFAAAGVANAQGFVELGVGQAMYDVEGAPGVSVDDEDTTFAISGGWMFHPNVGAFVSASAGVASARVVVARRQAIDPRFERLTIGSAGPFVAEVTGGIEARWEY